MTPISRRTLLAAGAAAGALAILPAAARTLDAPLLLNDASQLNTTPVARLWRRKAGLDGAWLDELRTELKTAAAEGRPVAVGAARHSMGGQALPRDGVAMSLDVDVASRDPWIALDPATRTYRVAAGGRWGQVIKVLDAAGFSPAVMQSNNDFGVGATLSVNAHGWPTPYGPFGATVHSFRLMLGSGELVTCSHAENPELFALAVGGYGLFGIVTDVDLEMVENTLLRPSFELTPSAEIGPRLIAALDRDSSVRMAYGRLSVDARAFLREAMLVTYRPVPGAPPPADSGGLGLDFARDVFRAQIGSDAGKRARWYIETVLTPAATSGETSRNTLLNEPVANLAGQERSRTDILHEYFLPPEGLEPFLAACSAIIPASRQDLLNVTLRYVDQDRASVLSYAHGRRVGAVMLFSQRMTLVDDEDMRAMTERMIDACLEAGGSFYLPYRLHARKDQFARAYPRLDEFLDCKRRYDPELLFRNLMWDRYFAV